MAVPLKTSSMRTNLAIGMLVSAAYFLTGTFSLALALPTGYVSLFFIPAGIAIACVIVYGFRILPWVFLGSFCLNVLVNFSTDNPIAITSIFIAIGIATGSVIQAYAAHLVFSRTIGLPLKLDCGRDIQLFAFTTPIICVISATISNLTLWLAGNLNTSFVGSIATWWFGDTTGVLIMLPITLAFISEPRKLWRARILSVCVPVSILLVIFSSIYAFMADFEVKESLSGFRQLSQHIVNQISTRIKTQSVMSEQLRIQFGERHPVQRDEFRRIADSTLKQFNFLQAISWAAIVTNHERLDYQAKHKKDIADFSLNELDSENRTVPVGHRDIYYAVTYIEPETINKKALGFDLASHPDRHATIRLAMQTTKQVASPPITLVQETGSQKGILLMQKVDGGANGPGLISIVVRMGDFMSNIMPEAHGNVYARLIDVDASNMEVFSTFSRAPLNTDFKTDFLLGGRKYSLLTAPTEQYLASHHGRLAWWTFAITLLFTCSLCLYLLVRSGRIFQVEELVLVRTKELEEAKLVAEVDSKSKSEFLASMSHELRTPLNAVIGFSEVLKDGLVGELTAEQSDCVTDIYDSGNYLLFLIDDILDLAKLQAGRMSLQLSQVDLTSLLNDCVLSIHPKANEKHISINIETQDGLDAVELDSDKVKRIVNNMLSNSVKFSSDGGRISLRARRVTKSEVAYFSGQQPYKTFPITDNASEDFVEILCQDTGKGVSSADMDRMFSLFTQLDSGYSRKHSGTGIGLAMVKLMAELHSGTVGIESAEHSGASLYVWLASRQPGK